VTWQNGEVSRGPDGIRRFYQEMIEGEGSILSNLVSTLKVDDLSILHGPDTAIAFGSIHISLPSSVRWRAPLRLAQEILSSSPAAGPRPSCARRENGSLRATMFLRTCFQTPCKTSRSRCPVASERSRGFWAEPSSQV